MKYLYELHVPIVHCYSTQSFLKETPVYPSTAEHASHHTIITLSQCIVDFHRVPGFSALHLEWALRGSERDHPLLIPPPPPPPHVQNQLQRRRGAITLSHTQPMAKWQWDFRSESGLAIMDLPKAGRAARLYDHPFSFFYLFILQDRRLRDGCVDV